MRRKEKWTQFDRKPNAKCDYCGREFWRYPVELERNKERCKNTFCDMKCFGKWNKENLYSSLNTTCEYCGKKFHRTPSRNRNYILHFCCNPCQGKWTADNLVGEKSNSWQGGKTEQRKYELHALGYRGWRKKLLENAQCILCESKEFLELHHIESRKENPKRIKDESNVIPICEMCHDVLHSNSRKGRELRETLNAILAQGNPQPSQSNIVKKVDWTVQRLTSEDTITNKLDTSTAPEKDEIVRACLKKQDTEIKSFCDNKTEQTRTTGLEYRPITLSNGDVIANRPNSGKPKANAMAIPNQASKEEVRRDYIGDLKRMR